MCEYSVDGRQLECVSDFEHLGSVVNESCTYAKECWRKGVMDLIRSIMNVVFTTSIGKSSARWPVCFCLNA